MNPTQPQTTTSTPSTRTEQSPVWARATVAFCKESFDVRSREDFVEALEAFADLAPGEQAFHQAHLVFRQVQALDDIHRVLTRIDAKLGGLDADTLSGVKHLPAIRKALVAIAKGQEEMLEVLEADPNRGAVAGEADDDDDDDDDEQEDGDEGEDDDEGSDLADAIEGDVVEEEDHGNGDDVEVVVPDAILPAGARPARPELTAEEALFAQRDGSGS